MHWLPLWPRLIHWQLSWPLQLILLEVEGRVLRTRTVLEGAPLPVLVRRLPLQLLAKVLRSLPLCMQCLRRHLLLLLVPVQHRQVHLLQTAAASLTQLAR